MGGTLFFNRLSYSPSSSYIFGGQIYQFNIFSEALSSADVKKIAEGGLCMDLTEFSGTGDLRWEYILSQSRSGSVREVEIEIDDNDMVECLKTLLKRSQEELANVTGRLNETESQLSETEVKLETVTGIQNTTREELEAVRGELNSTEEKLDVVSSDLNKTEATMESVIGQLNSTQEELNTTREELGAVIGKLNSTEEKLDVVSSDLNKTEATMESVIGQLNSTQEELNITREELGTVKSELNSTQEELQTESAQHNKTGEQLDTCSTSLTSTLTQLETARTFHNITRWDVLYTTPYYKKVLTEELFQQLSSSWGMLGKFVGVNITEGVVDHFRQYHKEPVCDVFEQVSYPMFKQFEGLEWTRGISDHLRDTHLVSGDQDSPCQSDTESDTES
ncbi:uncharacterized protein LOC134818143 [Bolinopsis microptera]|uniref:uncharacterized protein LOC134818143 n=1 Tax=Bolinopsis microptera TaxID=2820187 RepID=UPI003079B9A3